MQYRRERRLILDGVTGAGKSSMLKHMENDKRFGPWMKSARVIDEDRILGDVMDVLQNRELNNERKWSSLFSILREVVGPASSGVEFLLERFHPTFYALVPDWNLFKAVDDALFPLDFKVVLLTYNEKSISTRGLDRVDRAGSDWRSGMIQFYGGYDKTIEAIALSQRRRRECMKKSKLPFIEIDTTEMRWSDYVRQVSEFDGSSVKTRRHS